MGESQGFKERSGNPLLNARQGGLLLVQTLLHFLLPRLAAVRSKLDRRFSDSINHFNLVTCKHHGVQVECVSIVDPELL